MIQTEKEYQRKKENRGGEAADPCGQQGVASAWGAGEMIRHVICNVGHRARGLKIIGNFSIFKRHVRDRLFHSRAIQKRRSIGHRFRPLLSDAERVDDDDDQYSRIHHRVTHACHSIYIVCKMPYEGKDVQQQRYDEERDAHRNAMPCRRSLGGC